MRCVEAHFFKVLSKNRAHVAHMCLNFRGSNMSMPIPPTRTFEDLQASKDLCFEPPLDPGIRDVVLTLIAHGVEAFESCEGGKGHSYAEPTVRFEGSASEGMRALAVALENGFPVRTINRTWGMQEGEVHGPWWEMKLWPPKDSAQWQDRDTTSRYAAEASTRNIQSRVDVA